MPTVRPLRRIATIAAVIASLAIAVVAIPPASAQGNRPGAPGFWVTGVSEVTVSADEAIVIMQVRGTGRTASDALAVNDDLTRQISDALDARNFRGKYTFTANQLIDPQGPQSGPRVFQPSAQTLPMHPYRPSLQMAGANFQVVKYVILNFSGAELTSSNFDAALAIAIDALTAVGAEPFSPWNSQQPLTAAGSVLYTLKNPERAQLEAIRIAAANARMQAEEVARDEGFKLGGVLDAGVNRPLLVQLPPQQDLTIFDALHIHYYSSTRDAVSIPATYAVEYAVKK
jgi:Protein of unknown function (DUF541)